MDSFEWNKIFGAVLGTALFVVALYIGVEGLMEPEKAAKPGMDVAVTDEHGPSGETPMAEVAPDWGTVLPTADLAAGENVHKRCQQCHDFADGGPNKIGPNLWGIVGSKRAQKAGFAYSAPMQALADSPWGYDQLDQFVKNPKAAVSGTKMSFTGLSKQQDRINLIAYMRSLSASPLAIPAPNPAAAPTAPAEGAPAEGTVGEPAGELQAPPPGTAPATPPTHGTPPATQPATPATTSPTPAPAAPASGPSPTTPPGDGH